MDKSNKQISTVVPFHVNVFAGATAGAIELLTLYPLDVVKTRMQIQNSRSTAVGNSNLGVISTLVEIQKKEGIGRLYRGIAPPLFVEPLKRAAKFTVNEELKKSLIGENIPTMKLVSLSGFLAGCVEAITVAPAELVKVRLQSKKFLRNEYKNTFHAFTSVFKNEGISAFMIGAPCAILRNGIWASTYFSTTFRLKQLIIRKWKWLKIRICTFTLSAILYIVRNEGVGALWKGYRAKVMRLAPGGGIMMMAFTAITSYWKDLQK
eukprot:GSMAST32.ASY1.ANO1.2086.1 assembled CDS